MLTDKCNALNGKLEMEFPVDWLKSEDMDAHFFKAYRTETIDLKNALH
jgi:hypothetical protein